MRFPLPLTFLASILAGSALAQGGDPGAPRVWAITGAKIVTAPGKTIASGTLVLRDGLIEAVGEKVSVPGDATVIDGKGWTLYPGFVDASTRLGMPTDLPRPERGDRYPVAAIQAENSAASLLKPDASAFLPYKQAGFGAALVAPATGLIGGTSAAIVLGDSTEPSALTLNPTVGMHAQPGAGGGFGEYPGALMGQLAATRQALSDARWLAGRLDAYAKNPAGQPRPAASRALLALRPVVAEKKLPLVVRASGAREIERALALGREFGIVPILDGGTEAYAVIEKLKASGASVLLSLDALTPPTPPAPGAEPDKPTLQSLRARALAPTTAAALAKAGIPFAFSTGAPADALKNVRRFVAGGLSEDAALTALTLSPAKILGIDRQTGTLEAGKLGNVVAVSGASLFDPKAKLTKVFVDGNPVALAATPVASSAGRGSGGQSPAAPPIDIKKSLPPGVTPEMALQFLKADPESAKPFLPAGVTVEQAIAALEGKPTPPPGGGGSEPASAPGDIIAAPPAVGKTLIPALPPAIAKSFVIRGATVWTSGKAGILKNADVLVSNGKVVAVGVGLSAPVGTLEIDGKGKHVTPGMIDCHSHTAVSGGVNEGSNIVTAECRIEDVLNPDDPNIYRQLAGGTTAANVLHGSANAIGGQNAVVKWRWGADADGLLVKGAPKGIKFALGENPTRSNSGFSRDGEPRYPIGRMGVERVIRARFLAAKDYLRRKKAGEPIRPDYQLEALGEILEGKRLVHCHSYRADEILMLIRLADELGFKIATFQHVLEGYKVADEIAKHGAGGSTFSDWWGYKIEAIDAIPQNGALMTRRGVTMSFNSDDNELARRLNADAGKAVRWGGLTPEEALKLVTINPAKQLGIDRMTGSLEAGKDADVVLWSGDPLAPTSRAEKTFVDGTLYFDREADLASRKEIEAEKVRLVAAFKTPDPKPAPQPPVTGEPNSPITGGQGATVAGQGAIRAMVSSNPPVIYGKEFPVTALVGATVHPASGPAIEKGVVLMQGERILAVGDAKTVKIPAKAIIVKLDGKHVWPGMVDANNTVGVNEIDSRRETQDAREQGTFQPELFVAHVVNPDSEAIKVARAEGVLSSFLMPSGGTFSGEAALIDMDGWTWEEMAIRPSAGLVVTLPSAGGRRRFGELTHLDDAEYNDEDGYFRAGQAPQVPGQVPGGRPGGRRGPGAAGAAPGASTAEADALKPVTEFLEDARRYQKARDAEASGAPKHDIDPKFEAMIPVLKGERPVFVRASSKKEIETAVSWAKKEGFALTIVGGTEADQCAELLKKENVPVLLGHVLELPSTPDAAYDEAFTKPARLVKAGVKFALTGDGESEKVRNLAQHAATASAFGLSADDALKAITLWPAQILGVGDKIGSLDGGKDANLFVTDGDLFLTTTKVLSAYVKGKPVDLTSKQSRLYDRWKSRPLPAK